MGDIRSIKKSIRKDIIRKRSAIEQGERLVANRQIRQHMRELQIYQDAQTVMYYIDYRGEVGTRALIEAAWETGKVVGIPLTIPAKKAMRIFQINSWDDLKKGNYGILEPRSDVCREIEVAEIALVLAPGVAFDEKLNRMGYGGGYYDRFAKKVSQSCIRIALAYEMQIIDKVPIGKYDVPMDLLVTESRLLRK